MTDTEESKPKRTGRPKGRKTSGRVVQQKRVAKILDLRARGLSVSEIGGAVGLKDGRVKDVLRKFRGVFTELQNHEQYQSVRRDLLNATELLILKSMNDPEKVANANLNQAAYAFKQIYDARRLEDGLSTSNVASQSVTITYNPGARREEQ